MKEVKAFSYSGMFQIRCDFLNCIPDSSIAPTINGVNFLEANTDGSLVTIGQDAQSIHPTETYEAN